MGEEEDINEESSDNQRKNSGRLNVLPHQWKKGQSGNPLGRPKGKTMKEYAKELLACQTDEERQAFLNGIPKDKIWEMAEGKAEAKTDLYIKELPTPIIDVIPKDNGNKEDTEPKKEN